MNPIPSQPVIVGTGLIALDLIVSGDKSNPIKDWTGGTCGNVLAILSALDWQSYPVARLNGDAGSLRVREDLSHWGTRLDYAFETPSAGTPIIAQHIRVQKNGVSKHTFSWRCPKCDAWLPSYKAVTVGSAQRVSQDMPSPDVFFFDRASRGALILAEESAKRGAIVVFEPSAKGDIKLFQEALGLAHIIKYSDQRLANLPLNEGTKRPGLLEIHTLGQKGLRYRSILPDAKSRGWRELPAAAASRIVDTAGCGDWLTAGLLYKIGCGGLEKLRQIDNITLIQGLKFGQSLSAWNCQFEGARGGMYEAPKVSVQIDSDVSNSKETLSLEFHASPSAPALHPEPSCPSCH